MPNITKGIKKAPPIVIREALFPAFCYLLFGREGSFLTVL